MHKCKIQPMWNFLRITLTFCLIVISTPLPEIIKIGGVFESTDDEQELAFRYAIDRINTDISILPRSKLSPVVMKLLPNDSFHATKAVCELIEQGVAAIIGPHSPALYNVIQSSCNAFEVPDIYTWWDVGFHFNHHSVNLYPDLTALAKACVDMVNIKRWGKYTIIYKYSEDLIRYKDLLSFTSSYSNKIILRKLPEEQTYKAFFREMTKGGETNIILMVPVDNLRQILRDAQEVGMLTDYHNYLMTSLDFHTEDFKEFHSIRANITALRLVDPSRHQVISVIKDWIFGELRYGRTAKSGYVLKTRIALLYDAIALFSQALQDLDHSQPIQIYPISCSRPEVTTYGRSVVSYMKMIHIDGLTGNIKFNDKGHRHDITLDIVEIHRGIVTKVGTWNTVRGVNYTREIYSEYGDVLQILRNKILRVTTIVNHPFVMEKSNSSSEDGNRFQGYCIDLFKEISKIYGFRYEISLIRDNRYGSRNIQGKWNGIIRQLMDREADVALADLTITYERENVVDFTIPFMIFGISILLKHPNKETSHFFTFLSPLSLEVWVAIATSYLVITVVLYGVARFTPLEWVRRRRSDQHRLELENQFNLSTSIWFTTASFTQQGSNIAPRAMSTRILAITWWFFTLITLCSYTANLAAFMTSQRMSQPILTAEDLEKQSHIRYGCVEEGATASFFKNSDIPIYKRMWIKMESAQTPVFTKTKEEGINRVLTENYAFFMESTAIEYVTQRHCNLIQTGGLLDSRGYGIATPPGSPYNQLLSDAILKLKAEGILEDLKQKWWRNEEGPTCQQSYYSIIPLGLNVARVGGIFIFLTVGIGVACMVFAVEYLCQKRTQVIQSRPLQFVESQL